MRSTLSPDLYISHKRRVFRIDPSMKVDFELCWVCRFGC